jgi:hypothetical protein
MGLEINLIRYIMDYILIIYLFDVVDINIFSINLIKAIIV